MTNESRESIEPWPLHYVQTALWFLAATTTEQAEYLSPPFPIVLFHGAEGDFATGNPLYFMLAVCEEACARGEMIDEWMDADPTGVIGQLFRELRAILGQMLWKRLRESEDRFIDNVRDYPQMAALLSATRRYAKRITDDLGWNADVSRAKQSCQDLLDEYSYGAYSATLARPARG